jgi:SNF2 family DNA or RNA helicase
MVQLTGSYIKTPSTVASKAACYLSCDRRIALSGTPIQNKIEDIWALFKFLRIDPVDQKETFANLIGGPCKIGDSVGVARLQLVMRACTLRRTKDSKDESGKKVLEVPPRHDQVVKLQFSEQERAAYDEAKQIGAEKLEEYQAQAQEKGTKAKGSSLRNVLQHLLRLRQICDHEDLAAAGETEEDYDGTLMDLSVALAGIERDGLNMARAQSVFANRKATDADELQCTACNSNYAKYFPALYPDGEMEPSTDLAKLTNKPFLTKCLHIFCEYYIHDIGHSGTSAAT